MSNEMDRLMLVEDGSYPKKAYRACDRAGLDEDISRNSSNCEEKKQTEFNAADGKMSWAQKKLMVGLTVVSVLNGSLMAVMIPFFPVEAASRGVSQTVISGVFSCFAVVQMAVSPVVGRIAPVVGVTRLYNIGLATAGLTTIVFGMLYLIKDTRTFVAACFLVRVVEAAGTAAVSGCAFTIIGNQFASRASWLVALVGAAQSAGQSVAPAIGGGLYAAAGFGAPFYVLGGVMVAVAAANHWLMPALRRRERRASPLPRQLRAFAGSVQGPLCLLIVFAYSFVFLTFDASVAPYADAVLGVTPATLGLFFMVATAAYVLTSFVWARLSERAGNPYVLMSACLLVSAVALLLIPPSPLLGLAPRWWLLGLGMTLLEAFLGGAYIPCFQLMLSASVRGGLPDDLETQAFVSGVYWAAYSLGTVVGPLSGGLLVDAFGFPVMMTALAALILLVALLVLLQAAAAAFAGRAGTWPAVATGRTSPACVAG